MKKHEKLKIINPKAAGIDIGSKSHFVAIGQNEEDNIALEIIFVIFIVFLSDSLLNWMDNITIRKKGRKKILNAIHILH